MTEATQQAPAGSSKQIVQPTSYGNPRKTRDKRFYVLGTDWLAKANRVLLVLVAIAVTVAIGLLVYAGVGIVHSENYASDGSAFSCRLDTVQGSGK